MRACPTCAGELEATGFACRACGLEFGGSFAVPRLARLDGAQSDLVERIVLAGGNLKQVAAEFGVSYPTLRKRLDVLIEALSALRRRDEAAIGDLLGEVEAGRMTAERAARLMREMQGGA